MNLGFVNVYPYRPHGHHAKFLEMQASKIGWKTYALVCDSAVDHCYVRELKGSGKFECVKCILGGLSSFSFDQVDSVSKYFDSESNIDSSRMLDEKCVESSAYTLTRVESFKQRNSPLVSDMIGRLLPAASQFYQATTKWVKDCNLDAVIVFNGRMDLTRAVTEACEKLNVDYITHERPLFGNGLILNKNQNCSSLKKIHVINKKYSNKPLTKKQSLVAAQLGLERLSTGNRHEWKQYNSNPTPIENWPLPTSGLKVLICPSSKNELLGHPDWETEWADNTDAIDIAVKSGIFDYSDIVVRFHPSWSVDFGQVKGDLCAQHYRSWCHNKGVYFIDTDDTTDTLNLIQLADLVVVNGSTVALEAGLIGKPILCLGPSSYTFSGISEDVLSIDELYRLDVRKLLSRDPLDVIKKTLRFYYSKAAREPLFVDQVRSNSIVECDFYETPSQQVFSDLLLGSRLLLNDSKCSDNDDDENATIKDYFIAKSGLHDLPWDTDVLRKVRVSRKHIYILIDYLRRLRSKGV